MAALAEVGRCDAKSLFDIPLPDSEQAWRFRPSVGTVIDSVDAVPGLGQPSSYFVSEANDDDHLRSNIWRYRSIGMPTTRCYYVTRERVSEPKLPLLDMWQMKPSPTTGSFIVIVHHAGTRVGVEPSVSDWGQLPKIALSAASRVASAPTKAIQSSRAFDAFTDLRTWLHLTVPEAADLVGVGRTTPITSWLAKGHEPRAKKARRLYQLHSLIGAMVRRYGEDGAYTTLHAGSPPLADLMSQPDLRELSDAVERLAIAHHPRGPSPGADLAPAEEAIAVRPGGEFRPITTKPVAR